MKHRKKGKVHGSAPMKPIQKPIPFKAVWFWAVAIGLAAIPFALGKYFEFKTPGPFDSGAYVYSAQSVLQGAKIGVDHQPSAQTGTLLVNMLGVKLFGFDEIGPEIIQMVLQAGALILMAVVLHQLYGRLAAGASLFITSFYLSAPHLAKCGNVKEQFMIAFMVIGVSCYVLGQLKGRWWWTLLAGMALSWGPMFKETGTSALGAIGLFVLIQPFFKWRSWKATIVDIGLLIGGFTLAMGPVILWLSLEQVDMRYWPYGSILRVLFPADQARVGSYVTDARKMVASWEVAARILRFYGTLCLPIGLAVAGGILAIIRAVCQLRAKDSDQWPRISRFVLLFGIWWALDMAYVWISPRTYEQYFLPLNASALMCGAFVFACYNLRLKLSEKKTPLILVGAVVILIMIAMAGPIAFGMKTGPSWGNVYMNPRTGQPERRRGYTQRLAAVQNRVTQPWEQISAYIQKKSTPEDTIYVWGWRPGIYVKSQRLSSAPKAFEGNMHTRDPNSLAEAVTEILEAFTKTPPKFIVDSRKSHFPWIRPNLELWPHPPRNLKQQPEAILKQWQWNRGYLDAGTTTARRDAYDAFYTQFLTISMDAKERNGRGKADPAELERYRAMRPLRDYLMDHYVPIWDFSPNDVLFQRR
jgi:hypothetical protein